MTVATATAQPVGRLVGRRYRLRTLLGRGATGRVWLAEDELLGRLVALKQHLPTYAESAEADRQARARALNEARAVARVSHRGVVEIHDVVRDGNLIWIVMEPLSGCTLSDRIAAGGPLPIREAAQIAIPLLDALQTIHSVGIVHCDVKPANVYLCDDGRVVLTDFGIAYIADEDDEVDSHRTLPAGSPAYMAPEQLRGASPRPACDLFSLGAMLYAAVEGKSPFEKSDVFATLAAVMEDTPAPWRAGPLRSVIAGLLAKDPVRRLTAAEALAALEEILLR